MEHEKLIAAVRRAQSGDQAALTEVYDLSSKMVYYTALKITGNQTDAEDAAQDTFMQIFTKLNTLQDAQTYPKWAKTIAANISKNYCKKKKPLLFKTDEEEQETLGSIPELSDDFLPELYADKQEGCRLIAEIIDGLPEKQRAVVIMHYYDEMSVLEIADALETNENTIKSALIMPVPKLRRR